VGEKNESGLSAFEQSVMLINNNRRLDNLEGDMRTIKPIVYETATSAKQIEKSVAKMEKNSEQTKNFIVGSSISGVVAIVFVAIKQLFGI